MFRINPAKASTSGAPASNNQNTNNANTGTGQNPAGNNNPANNNPNGNPADPNAQPQKEANPMDSFKNLWHTDPAKQVDAAPEFKLPTDTMDKVTSGLDFTKGIDPAVMQKAQAGDWNSVMEIMQHSSRQAYRSAMEHGAHLTGNFVSAREGFNEKSFSSKVRGELASNELSSIPNSSHPAVKAQLMDIAQRFRSANPDASPKEIQEATVKYFKEFIAAITPQNPDQNGPNGTNANKETNWDDYFDGNSGSKSQNG